MVGYRLDANQIAYGGISDWRRLHFPQNNFNVTIRKEEANYAFKGLTPWSNYSISCVAMNDDKMDTKTNVQYITVPVGSEFDLYNLEIKGKC